MKTSSRTPPSRIPGSSRLAALALFASLVLAPPAASAHGRFPEGLSLAFHPSDPNRFVINASRGFFVTDDGGATFDWICQGQYQAILSEDPSLVFFKDGRLAVGVLRGLVTADASLCAFDFPEPALHFGSVGDVTRDPSDPRRGFAVTAAGNADNVLFRTEDAGASVAQVGGVLAHARLRRVRIAPSSPDVIYVSGVTPPTAASALHAYVYRSTDGGASFETIEIPLAPGEIDCRVEAIDPADPARFFLVVDGPTDGSGLDRLLVGTGGGASFEPVLEAFDIRQVVTSEDGQTVWTGGRRRDNAFDGGPDDAGHGLFRSTDRGASFERIHDEVGIHCLGRRGDTLFACTDQFLDDALLVRSDDGGDTLHRVFAFADVEGPHTPACAPPIPLDDTCEVDYADLVRDTGVIAPKPSSGCAAGGGTSAPAVAFAVAALAVITRRKRSPTR